MTWSRTVLTGALAAALLTSGAAWAGACCTGSTSPVPTEIGECEHSTAGIGLAADVAAGRWDHTGKLRTSSLGDQALISTLAAGHRLNRRWQVGAVLPVRVNRMATDSTVDRGAGVGDAILHARWDPREERPRIPGLEAPPVPIFTFGARLPLGTSWTASKSPLHADVTGRGQTALIFGFSAERTLGKVPWSAGITTSLGATTSSVHPEVTLSGSVGRYLGSRATLLGTLHHTETWAVVGDQVAHSYRTGAGMRWVLGQRLRWRMWAGADADLPVPGFGRAATRRVQLDAGMVVVR